MTIAEALKKQRMALRERANKLFAVSRRHIDDGRANYALDALHAAQIIKAALIEVPDVDDEDNLDAAAIGILRDAMVNRLIGRVDEDDRGVSTRALPTAIRAINAALDEVK